MYFLKKWLLPKELKKLLETLNLVEDDFNIWAFPDTKQWVTQLICDNRKDVLHFIKEKKITPMNMVFLLIADIVGEKLSTGKYHIYTGVLNPQGEDLWAIYKTATEKLVASGYLTREAADKDIGLVIEGIKSVG